MVDQSDPPSPYPGCLEQSTHPLLLVGSVGQNSLLQPTSGHCLRPKGSASLKVRLLPILFTTGNRGLAPFLYFRMTLKVHPTSRYPCKISWTFCCNCIIIHLLLLPSLISLSQVLILKTLPDKTPAHKSPSQSFLGTRLNTVSRLQIPCSWHSSTCESGQNFFTINYICLPSYQQIFYEYKIEPVILDSRRAASESWRTRLEAKLNIKNIFCPLFCTRRYKVE